MTEREIEVMHHALGWPKNHRNYFVTEAESSDGVLWRGLVDRGLATASAPCSWMGDMTVYRVSDAGRAALAGKERGDE